MLKAISLKGCYQKTQTCHFVERLLSKGTGMRFKILRGRVRSSCQMVLLVLILLFLLSTFIFYQTTVMTYMTYHEDHENCTEWFAETLRGNLDVISKYPRGNANLYFHHINGNLSQPKTMITSFPVILSAADKKFYGVIQGLIKTVHLHIFSKYKDVRFIVYDMGLSKEQLQMMNTYCACEVRKFPFHLFPPHVQVLNSYAWKPLMIKTVLMEFGWVWWMDGSTRILTDNLDITLQYSKNNSMLFFSNPSYYNPAYHTHVETMKYLGEDACKFRELGETEAGFNIFRFDLLTNIIVNQWAACALNENCIAPKGSEKMLHCDIRKKQYGRCHRFDQSVLSIILRRLFHDRNDYPLINLRYIREFKRGENVNYFEG